MKKVDKKLYLGVIFIILIVIMTIIMDRKSTKDEKAVENSAENVNGEQLEEISNQNITEVLEEMEERDRMEYYFGIFLDYVEEGEYEKAYDLLYDDFKKRYFPTIEDFKNYVPTVFSEMTNIEHENIERNGDLYILWINVTDAINGKPGEERKMNIVIRENDYNDFVLSFSVI